MAAEFGRGIDVELGHDDQHLELRRRDAVRLHMAVDDPVLEHGRAPQEHAQGAILEVIGMEMLHQGTRKLPRQ